MNNFLYIFAFLALFVQLAVGQNTEDCGKKFGCFLSPNGCQDDNCEFIVKWSKADDNHIHFVLNTKLNYLWWNAIAFSTDQIMGNDSVALCKLDKSSQKSTVETYWNNYHSPPDIFNSTYRSFGLSYESISFNNGWLLCSFVRQIRNNSLGTHFFDLNNMYYLMVAKSVLNDKFEPYYHYNNKTYSADQIDFRKISVAAAQTIFD